LVNISKQRNTKYRSEIVKILEESSSPLSADEIHNIMKKKNPRISASTVYRNLETLQNSNLIKKHIIMNDSRARYELKKHKHYFICTKCNLMIPLTKCPIADIRGSMPLGKVANIYGHNLEVYGECSDCNAKNNLKPKEETIKTGVTNAEKTTQV